MQWVKNRLHPLFDSPARFSLRDHSEQGQGLTEYLILLILISLVSIGVVQGLGAKIKNRIKFSTEQIGSKLILEPRD